jgi:hypothetical protein
MSGVRLMVQDPGGLMRAGRAGDNRIEMVTPFTIATDANDILTVTKVASGVINYTGFTAARTLTTDTAANLLIAFPMMDIGDTVLMQIGVTQAFVGTLAAGTGVTLKGKAAVPASGAATLYFTRTAAATFDCLCI